MVEEDGTMGAGVKEQKSEVNKKSENNKMKQMV